MARAARAKDACGLCDAEPAAGRDADAAEVIPCAQLGERDAEAIGDGDERIAAAGSVHHGARGGLGRRRNGHGERFDAVQAFV